MDFIKWTPVGSLCHTRGVVRRPSYVIIIIIIIIINLFIQDSSINMKLLFCIEVL